VGDTGTMVEVKMVPRLDLVAISKQHEEKDEGAVGQKRKRASHQQRAAPKLFDADEIRYEHNTHAHAWLCTAKAINASI
jgi:ABC-type Zn2+ transport system substrate-binding protein/surface adhesin